MPALELKEELFDLLSDVENRGIGAPSDLADDIFEVVGELEESAPGYNWAESPLLAGRWRLRYTSSKTFANNEGLSGYARDLQGVATPELDMRLETRFKRLVYEERLELEQGSIAALFGKFAGAESICVECAWSRTRDGLMAVESQTVVVGDRSWEPADRQDKAVRALSAGQPIYLDNDLFLLRSKPDYIVWVFQRV